MWWLLTKFHRLLVHRLTLCNVFRFVAICISSKRPSRLKLCRSAKNAFWRCMQSTGIYTYTRYKISEFYGAEEWTIVVLWGASCILPNRYRVRSSEIKGPDHLPRLLSLYSLMIHSDDVSTNETRSEAHYWENRNVTSVARNVIPPTPLVSVFLGADAWKYASPYWRD